MNKIFNINTALKIMCKLYGQPFSPDDYTVEFKQGYSLAFIFVVYMLVLIIPIDVYVKYIGC